MAHYRVEYEGQGDLRREPVEVWAYRLAVERDGERFGVWNGGVDGRILGDLPNEGELAKFHRNGVMATARKLQDMAQHRELPVPDPQQADLIPLRLADVNNAATSRTDAWQPGDTVLEFDA